MSLKFIEAFDDASKKTAPGSKGTAILNILIVISSVQVVSISFKD